MRNILLVLFSLGVFSCNTNQTKEATSGQTNTTNSSAKSTAVTYNNPVLPGDYADPSVVRVGDDYWATATSSEWAPLYPILHSKNLVDWETVGHVFPEKGPAWADAHFWAPEITYDNGKYYIYYTAQKKGGNLCVGVASATQPTGPYTDLGPLVCQEVGSIDAFPIRDEKGELYMVWKEDGNSQKLPTPIWGQKLKEDRTALVGEKFELFRNDPKTWEGGLVEGPFILKQNGYFYTFYSGDACCGRGCTYGVGVARSKTLRGPWEKYAANPILKQSDNWKCAGHGSVVSDAQGRDFYLYHAYKKDDFVYPGRQGLLDEITWNKDGWPQFAKNAPSTAAAAPLNQNAPDIYNLNDEFNQKALSESWQWPVNQKPAYQLKPEANGQLLVKASPAALGTVLAQRTLTGDYATTTLLDKSSLTNGATAGLAAVGDNSNAVGVSVSKGDLILWSVKDNKLTTLDKIKAPAENTVQLKLTARKGDQLEFAWSTNGTAWNQFNKGQAIDAAYLPPWDRGVRTGLFAKGPTNTTATFDWFKVENLD
ncbi:family 43 glycosylhydrolase [Adhaeribacter pallidiroseus]|uniref:Xylan 1,4-beta-xylosidase n=1 Tax=Adhaeribacter pallidiroseus TaxID=2072847 RepID=A0A369QI41_9BACT|nr:family 43 glycosylhydrolase [Adhaeribacter pallidiroseus]RDC61968.1 Xylan 1,4-beta-xylosidase [Adhaeribacter pallidiroseus]